MQVNQTLFHLAILPAQKVKRHPQLLQHGRQQDDRPNGESSCDDASSSKNEVDSESESVNEALAHVQSGIDPLVAHGDVFVTGEGFVIAGGLELAVVEGLYSLDVEQRVGELCGGVILCFVQLGTHGAQLVVYYEGPRDEGDKGEDSDEDVERGEGADEDGADESELKHAWEKVEDHATEDDEDASSASINDACDSAGTAGIVESGLERVDVFKGCGGNASANPLAGFGENGGAKFVCDGSEGASGCVGEDGGEDGAEGRSGGRVEQEVNCALEEEGNRYADDFGEDYGKDCEG